MKSIVENNSRSNRFILECGGLGLSDHTLRGCRRDAMMGTAVMLELEEMARDVLQQCTPHEVLLEWSDSSPRAGQISEEALVILNAARDDARELLDESDMAPVIQDVAILDRPHRINVGTEERPCWRTAVIVQLRTELDKFFDGTISVALLTEPLDAGSEALK